MCNHMHVGKGKARSAPIWKEYAHVVLYIFIQARYGYNTVAKKDDLDVGVCSHILPNKHAL